MRTLIDNPKFETARAYFEAACAASRRHSAKAAEAFNLYGDHGPQISGCVRDHFPEDVKNILRIQARLVSEFLNKAYANRPARVRSTTMRQLGREVATRFGSGFYGPQPLR